MISAVRLAILKQSEVNQYKILSYNNSYDNSTTIGLLIHNEQIFPQCSKYSTTTLLSFRVNMLKFSLAFT